VSAELHAEDGNWKIASRIVTPLNRINAIEWGTPTENFFEQFLVTSFPRICCSLGCAR
jgi:hypothetical protein